MRDIGGRTETSAGVVVDGLDRVVAGGLSRRDDVGYARRSARDRGAGDRAPRRSHDCEGDCALVDRGACGGYGRGERRVLGAGAVGSGGISRGDGRRGLRAGAIQVDNLRGARSVIRDRRRTGNRPCRLRREGDAESAAGADGVADQRRRGGAVPRARA